MFDPETQNEKENREKNISNQNKVDEEENENENQNQSINSQRDITITTIINKMIQQNKKNGQEDGFLNLGNSNKYAKRGPEVLNSSSSTTASTTSPTAKIKKTNENGEELTDEELNEESFLEQDLKD